MQSHDAEFSDHGHTPIPEFMRLDNEWKRLVAIGNDAAVSLEAKFQRLAADYELALTELRDMARMSLAENNTPQGANHYLEGASKPRSNK